ncbi:MAG: YkvA family protein [Spirochaetes bacterium]|nr:YkvA family protein [Spirochaetota bacterium]
MKNKFTNIFFNFRDSIGALLFALKHPEVTIWSKIIIVVALAYAFSPIDVIPDFIPFIGYIDDAIIVPFLFFLAIKSIPEPIFQQCKLKAHSTFKKSIGFILLGLLLVIIVWAFVGFIIYGIIAAIIRLFHL